MIYHRIVEQSRIEGVTVGEEFGTFPATLATQGEASDGHILSIKGGQFPESLPLQADHANSAFANLGRLLEFKKELRAKPARVRTMGRIRLTGDGPGLETRRDVLDAIEVGDLTALSVRWEGIKVTERVALPKNHPAHVPSDEKDFRKRFGAFFHEWEALEGSVVAIPSDRKAQIGRSVDSESEAVIQFWRTLQEGLEQREQWESRFSPLEKCLARTEALLLETGNRLTVLEERQASPALPQPDPETDTDHGDRTLSEVLESGLAEFERKADSRERGLLERVSKLAERIEGRIAPQG